MLEIFDKNRRRIAIAENACGLEEERRINSIWYLRFALPYDDSKNEYCLPFNYVRLDGGELYRIMPASTEIAETGLITYQCEHVLATLIDTVLFGYHVVGNLGVYTRDCINYVLNKQLIKNWVLYECDFSRQFEYGWEQETLLSALFSIATPLSDYMWVTDTTVYPWRLSLKRIDMSQRPELYIRANWNMLRYADELDPQQICTRLYPLGYGEGVNQLTIKNVNNGVPYLQSPKAYTDRYGIIERVWIDRRYEDPESLKAAAQVMLDELQDPVRRYEIGFAQLDAADYNKAAIGKRTRILFPDLGTKVDTFITDLTLRHDDIMSSTVVIANHSTSIASDIANMADRQRIEQSYAQGATQLFAQSVQANATTTKGAKLNFYIPSEMRIVNAVKVKIQLDRFRSYSQATEGGGATTATSSDGGADTATSSDGGASTVTSSDGGATKATSTSGGAHTSTSSSGGGGSVTSASGGGTSVTSGSSSRSTSESGLTINQLKTGYSAGGGESVSTGSGGGTLSSHTHTYIRPIWSYDGGSGNYGWHRHNIYADLSHSHGMSHTHSISISAHSHSVSISAHSHSVSIPAHNHSVSIGNHTHSINIKSHKHTITIRAHKHTVEIKDHKHNITQGIFEFGSPTGASLYINDVRKAGIGKDAELDITQYLVENGTIPRGRWHKIEVRPDDLAYITIDITVQGFVQSRGDNTV